MEHAIEVMSHITEILRLTDVLRNEYKESSYYDSNIIMLQYHAKKIFTIVADDIQKGINEQMKETIKAVGENGQQNKPSECK